MRVAAHGTLRNLLVASLCAGVAASLAAADRPKPVAVPRTIDFVRQIQPVLRKHCYQCHGHDVQEAGLRLDVKRQALAGGEHGKVIVPGRSGKSSLVARITASGPDARRMPPPDEGTPLSPAQIALLRSWIDAGAAWPDGVDPVGADAGSLWSFDAVQSPAVPQVGRPSWVRNPIDAFVLARLESAGLVPAPAADHLALIRRATFDLHGLPPTIDDLDRFTAELAQRPPDSVYEDLVDRLLANPHYGERWARHWLDLVRYADSNGYEVDGEKPLAWKYRDYVIRALNRDVSYDRFVLEQLAGDELPDANPQTVIATGFYRVGPWDAERGASVQPSEMVAETFNELDDMVSTTSQVFLGLTMGCARCHDHKFDPLSSKDYYSFVSIFRPLTRQRNGRTELTRPAVPPPALKEKNAADQRIGQLQGQLRSLTAPLRTGLLESGRSKLPADAIAALKVPADKRSDNQRQLVKRYESGFDKEVTAALQQPKLAAEYLSAEVRKQLADAEIEITRLRDRFHFPAGYFFYEPSPPAPVTHLLKRGNPSQPGVVVQPAVPAAIPRQLGRGQPKFETPDAFTSRRRISLARWITSSDNPLTARVFVNRVWQYHFGSGLVRTPSDFGRRGVQPTHPELLDWLADWFVHDAGQSIKKLHRLIMTSNTYRMSKRMHHASAVKDPDNRLLWRFPYRRLEVEAIRDAMLAVSGQLQPKLYGPCMYPHIPENARRSGYSPQSVWKAFDERSASRRTIYAYVKRTLIVPFLDTLNFCDTTRSTDRRETTVVAPQALELLNGEFVNRQARHFAGRLRRQAATGIDQQILLGYRLAVGRPPTMEEQATLRSYWDVERGALRKTQKMAEQQAGFEATVRLCRILLNLNEFVYVD